ncbi:MAG: hypothetical protein JXB26_08610 [Candidatus Aminicenantes bacterium]|nr:hypothetical protein [Candidatus Aminicenantes bacterium]
MKRIAAIVTLFFLIVSFSPRLRGEEKSLPLISIGVGVGYFFSFLDADGDYENPDSPFFNIDASFIFIRVDSIIGISGNIQYSFINRLGKSYLFDEEIECKEGFLDIGGRFHLGFPGIRGWLGVGLSLVNLSEQVKDFSGSIFRASSVGAYCEMGGAVRLYQFLEIFGNTKMHLAGYEKIESNYRSTEQAGGLSLVVGLKFSFL